MAENDTLTRRQRRALAALLSQPTIAAAAQKAGIGRKTMYSYMAEPAFQTALQQQQSQLLQGAVARLAALLHKSLDVVSLDMEPAVDDALRLRAAGLVLRHIASLLTFADLERRIMELEALHNEFGKAH